MLRLPVLRDPKHRAADLGAPREGEKHGTWAINFMGAAGAKRAQGQGLIRHRSTLA